MSLKISADTQRDIENLIHDHAWLVDHGEAHRLFELYTEDGKISGIGAEKAGRAAIVAYGQARANMTARATCHLCSNIRLFPVDGNSVRGNVIVTLFRHDGEGLGDASPIAVGEWSDVFKRDASGEWKFSERKLKIVFESAAHRS